MRSRMRLGYPPDEHARRAQLIADEAVVAFNQVLADDRKKACWAAFDSFNLGNDWAGKFDSEIENAVEVPDLTKAAALRKRFAQLQGKIKRARDRAEKHFANVCLRRCGW